MGVSGVDGGDNGARAGGVYIRSISEGWAQLDDTGASGGAEAMRQLNAGSHG